MFSNEEMMHVPPHERDQQIALAKEFVQQTIEEFFVAAVDLRNPTGQMLTLCRVLPHGYVLVECDEEQFGVLHLNQLAIHTTGDLYIDNRPVYDRLIEEFGFLAESLAAQALSEALEAYEGNCE